jgi:hypothetical protein
VSESSMFTTAERDDRFKEAERDDRFKEAGRDDKFNEDACLLHQGGMTRSDKASGRAGE